MRMESNCPPPPLASRPIDFSELISDVNGDLLTLSIDDPDHGSLVRNADGTYTYIPRNNFVPRAR